MSQKIEFLLSLIRENMIRKCVYGLDAIMHSLSARGISDLVKFQQVVMARRARLTKDDHVSKVTKRVS